jgi:NAD(P)-dependent dehydrogenase (short-subunit alcohol dehydrogenase family)
VAGEFRKSIFITGAGSGIGREVAILFAQRGWFVGLADIVEARLAETAAILPAASSFTHRLDVCDRLAWDEALAAFAQASGGAIHALFNNAGVGAGGMLHELAQDEIDLIIDVNIRGVIYGAQAAYPYLKASAPDAVLINTSSAAGIYGTAGLAVYSATKFAVRGLTEALDVEWFFDRIRVRSLMPGFVDTPILNGPNNRKSNQSRRESIVNTGLSFVPIRAVAETVWRVANGRGRLHNVVGVAANQFGMASRWMPSLLRRLLRHSLAKTGVTEHSPDGKGNA